jgi:hypothetical protein
MSRRSNGRPRKPIQAKTSYDRRRKASRCRKYTTVKEWVHGTVKYHKVRLRTEDDGIAHDRYKAIRDLDDPQQAR